MNPARAYGNIPIFSPDGILMFNTNERKLKFYLAHNLAEPYQAGYRLTFTPNGLGHHDKSTEHLLAYPRKNQCVVSGDQDLSLLTRHHIVPVLFRKWMPEYIKSVNYQYVVLVRKDLHYKYTLEEQKYYKNIAEMFGVTDFEETLFLHASEIVKKRKFSGTLLKYSHLIPKESLKVLQQKFSAYTGLEPNFENYKAVFQEVMDTEKRYYKNADYNFGKKVIDKVTDYPAFEKLWLDHFIATMHPKFLPEDLTIMLRA
jgi:hypothetical protein